MAAPVDTETRTLATVKHLANPTSAQIEEAAKVLQQAFKCIGSAVVGGSLYVLVVPSLDDVTNAEVPSYERIIGVAVWFPPGTSPNGTAEDGIPSWRH